MRYYFVSEIARTHNISEEMLKYKIKSGHIAAIKQQTCRTNPERIAFLIPESELEKLKELKLTEPEINPKAQPMYYEMLFAEQEMQERIMQQRREEYRQKMQTPQIKALRTIYNGVYFRSRLEAKWAIFFDHCGIEWEYEPEGYQLENGMCYLPDFLLHGLRGYERAYDLYVEVKGMLTDEDAKKIRAFVGTEDDIKHRLLLVGNIFTHGSNQGYLDRVFDMHIKTSCPEGLEFFSYAMIDGDYFGAALGVNWQGQAAMFGDEGQYLYDCDEGKTESAYKAAKNAVFSREGIYQYSL